GVFPRRAYRAFAPTRGRPCALWHGEVHLNVAVSLDCYLLGLRRVSRRRARDVERRRFAGPFIREHVPAVLIGSGTGEHSTLRIFQYRRRARHAISGQGIQSSTADAWVLLELVATRGH